MQALLRRGAGRTRQPFAAMRLLALLAAGVLLTPQLPAQAAGAPPAVRKAAEGNDTPSMAARPKQGPGEGPREGPREGPGEGPGERPGEGPGEPGAPASPASSAEGCPPVLEKSASARPQDRGLMWRLVRDGRTSYLFGTVHVGKPSWARLGPLTAAALRASDVLALEIDPTDPAVIAALSAQGPGPTPPAPLQRRLLQAIERNCASVLGMSAMHPVLQATTLTVLDARWLGMAPEHSLELAFVQQARAQRRRIVSLETVEEQKRVLVPDDPAEAEAMLVQTLEQLENQTSRRVLERLTRAWEAGDLETLENYERWCECAATEEDRAYMRRINDERNAPLATRIEALHKQGRRVFAAIGALHMTGASALPALLAARGFTVERIEFAR